jgi:hypothetical protein
MPRETFHESLLSTLNEYVVEPQRTNFDFNYSIEMTSDMDRWSSGWWSVPAGVHRAGSIDEEALSKTFQRLLTETDYGKVLNSVSKKLELYGCEAYTEAETILETAKNYDYSSEGSEYDLGRTVIVTWLLPQYKAYIEYTFTTEATEELSYFFRHLSELEKSTIKDIYEQFKM